MIFLSHNHNDKPVVEPVALRLREIFGQDKVFYDSWSIQPGDSILDKMNEGLAAPEFVFFFVSDASLKSGMVKIEWQTGLFQATKGKCKIIPVRVDGSPMPSILMQNVYIDMFAQGIEVAIVQIVNVVQGNTTFTPQHDGFSNLSYSVTGNSAETLTITISASHLMEPTPSFLLLIDNEVDEVSVEVGGGTAYMGGFNAKVPLSDGTSINCHSVTPMGGAIVPKIPLMIKLTATGQRQVDFRGVLHRKTSDQYHSIPRKD